MRNPTLVIVDYPKGRRKELAIRDMDNQDKVVPADGLGKGWVWLYAEFWVTNEHHTEAAEILHAQLDSASLGTMSATSWNAVPCKIWDHDSGAVSPLIIAPREKIYVAAIAMIAAPSDGKGGWVLPDVATGTVVLTDKFNQTHPASEMTWF